MDAPAAGGPALLADGRAARVGPVRDPATAAPDGQQAPVALADDREDPVDRAARAGDPAMADDPPGGQVDPVDGPADPVVRVDDPATADDLPVDQVDLVARVGPVDDQLDQAARADDHNVLPMVADRRADAPRVNRAHNDIPATRGSRHQT